MRYSRDYLGQVIARSERAGRTAEAKRLRVLLERASDERVAATANEFVREDYTAAASEFDRDEYSALIPLIERERRRAREREKKRRQRERQVDDGAVEVRLRVAPEDADWFRGQAQRSRGRVSTPHH